MTKADKSRLGKTIYWTCTVLSVVMLVGLLLLVGPTFLLASSYSFVFGLFWFFLIVLPPVLLYGLGRLIRNWLAKPQV